ncbi:hypothetical protein KO489_15185 [Reinekea forsetii]|nr:hypothetical protein [Reinekea forsetii]
MKSSSRFFPVEIIRAEVRDTYFEDTYSVKPNNSADKTVEISLIHLQPKINAKSNQVLLIHDVFQTHWQFDEPPYSSLANQLLEAGYSVWLMDWRAHGASKKNKDASQNYLLNMAKYDLPAVVQFINEKRNAPIQMISVGYGAQMALHSINYTLPIAHYYCVNAKPVKSKKRYWIPGIKLLKRLKLVGKSWIKGAGTEFEHQSFFRHELKRHGLLSSFTFKEGKEALQAMKGVANTIVWVATNKKGVALAKRHLKQQARVQRILDKDVTPTLLELVIKQS